MNRLVFINGSNGIGKSTISSHLGDALDAIVIRTDEIRNWIRDEALISQHTYQEDRVADIVIATCMAYRGLGRDIVVDGAWHEAPMKKLFHALGEHFHTHAFLLRAEESVNVARDQARRPEQVQGKRVTELRAELDAVDWNGLLSIVDSTNMSSTQSAARILQMLAAMPANG